MHQSPSEDDIEFLNWLAAACAFEEQDGGVGWVDVAMDDQAEKSANRLAKSGWLERDRCGLLRLTDTVMLQRLVEANQEIMRKSLN